MPNDLSPDYQAAVERDYRRNAGAFVAWEFLWGLGTPFAMFATFVPAYLGALAAPKALIGLVLAFPYLFGAAQIAAGYWVPAERRLSLFRRTVAVCIVPWLAYAVAAAAWGGAWPAPVHWALFALALAPFALAMNGGDCIYWEMMTDNIPERRRGRLFGLRSAAIGVAGVGMGCVAATVLSHWETPQNFRVGFILGVGAFLGSASMLWIVRDHVNPAHETSRREGHPSFCRYLRQTVSEVCAEPNYRIFLFFRALLAVAAAGAPFMVDAAREQLKISAQAQGLFGIVFLATTASLSWVIGLTADRWGYRLVGGICGALLAGAFLLCLVARAVAWWYVAFGMYALAVEAGGMLMCNMSAEICPNIAPNRLLGVGNALVVVFVVAATTLGGMAVDLTGSYAPLFTAMLVLSLVPMMGFALIVREPRSGKLYMVKTIQRG